ncbi:MAG: phosphatidylglycerol lysyltransferase domain-containing protein, partial [Desulfobacterales bacterium]|nr:phosphatidylglycerol lysyltransferase domain-containing protein [Desulfobacterales bacterium]
MTLNFEKISLDKQHEYLDTFIRCPQKSSDYSFVNLWGWSDEYGLYWAWSDDVVWIKQTIPNEVFWAPIGSWPDIDWSRCFDKYFDEPITFLRIPEELLRVWEKNIEDRIRSEDERAHWDYIYDVKELIELKGNRFHKKKNLVNQFKKKYDYQYVPFDAKMIDMALAMQEDWCTWRDCESSEALSAENRAISRILDNWQTIYALTGGALLVGQEMVAYTIAEQLSQDTIVIHFEKGNPDHKGA